MRWSPVARSICQIAARPSSAAMPCSATLLFDPTVTYSREPSRLAITFLVQWELIGPAGSSTTVSPGWSIRV